ncbi:MAG: hypothetical protein U5J62_06680 [Desulfurivibrio sp.]|nr:hypothetical protein [Desulfurivibrio sp.]
MTDQEHSSLYPIIDKRVRDAVDAVIDRQVVPWSFFKSGKPFRISRFDGREIVYEGIQFDGSPRDVYWARYIEPYLESLCLNEISAATELAEQKGVDARIVFRELERLLKDGVRRVYGRMTDVDRKLRGGGNPRSVKDVDIQPYVLQMDEFIEDQISAELKTYRPISRIERWYRENKFLAWAIGVVIAVVGLWLRM